MACPWVFHGASRAVGCSSSRSQNPIVIVLVLTSCIAPCATLATSEHLGGIRGMPGRQKKSADDVYYVTRMADRFARYSSSRKKSLDGFHEQEQHRLEEAIRQATSDKEKSLLEISATSNEETRLEAQIAFKEMINFVTTLKQSMGAEGGAASCGELTCGARAFCSEQESKGARCMCEDGYEGNGFVCNPPRNFTARALLTTSRNGLPPQVADLSVVALEDKKIAVVFRDTSRNNRGYLMFGTPGLTGVTWTEPRAFSNVSQAYGPVLVELPGSHNAPDKVIVIAYRDDNRGGTGMLLNAFRNPTTGDVSFGPSKAYSRNQAQAVSLVPFDKHRVAVLYAEHVLSGVATKLNGGAMYGSAALAQVASKKGDALEIIGKHRFVSGPISRITSTRLSPTSFIVAYRHGETNAKLERTEASCMFGELRANELVFDMNHISLEPAQTQIWARSVALVQENVVAYTYHSGNEQLTKQAFIQVDPDTRRMGLLRPPEVLAHGFTPFVGTVSSALLPFGAEQPVLLQTAGPRLFSYYNKGNSEMVSARMCMVSTEGLPADCKDMDWLGPDLLSVAGAAVGDGRLVFVFTDARGSPYYQMVGLLEPDL